MESRVNAVEQKVVVREYLVRFEGIVDLSDPGSDCPGRELLVDEFAPWSYSDDGRAVYHFPPTSDYRPGRRTPGQLTSLEIEEHSGVARVFVVAEGCGHTETMVVEFGGPFQANGEEQPLPFVRGDLCVPLDFSNARAIATDMMVKATCLDRTQVG